MDPGVTLTPQLDRCCRGKAEVRIIKFKTTWSEFQMPSQTTPAEGKPRYLYSILKPHGQSFIISPELSQAVVCISTFCSGYFQSEFHYLPLCALAHFGCTGKLLFRTSKFHHLPRLSPKQLCTLAHLGCTRAADTS